ncbi:MAG: hypothetical protein ACHQVS_03155 [Candidatus Babeliales bacterium]
MKKHLLALLSVGSLVAMLPGCGSCCEKKEMMKEVTTEETANSEVAAVEAQVTEATPAQEAEAVPAEDAAADKH